MTLPQMLSKDNIQDRSAWRKRCLDLFFFEIAVCSQAFKDKFNDFGKLQMDMCDFIDQRKNPALDKYLSAFRGSYKTTVLLGWFAYFFAWNVELGRANSLSYYTAIKDNAYNFNSFFRTLITENELLQWIFPKMPCRENQFKEFTKNTVSFKDVRIDFVSMDTTQASKHTRDICNDDLENEKNYRTEFSREELKKEFEMQRAVQTRIKSKGIGHHVYTCTPYHIQGLTWKIRNETPPQNRFEAPCFIGRDRSKGSAFPERYTVDDFDDIKRGMSNSSWSSQYLLLPQAEEEALCLERWISDRVWSHLPENRWRTMVIDPGGAEANTNDASGITIVDTDESGDMYVVYAEELWLTPLNLIDTINNLKKTYTPDDIRIEKEKYSITIADMFQHKFPLMHISFVEHKGRNKEDRIWRLKQFFEGKRIWIGKNQEHFRNQLLEYPASKHDDILDSLSYHIDIRRVPKPGQRHYLPSGREFTPNIEPTFEEETNRCLAMQTNQEEALINDSIY